MTQEIPDGDSFKGKKFELSPTTYVDLFSDVGEEFMEKVLGFKPGEYLITDESYLDDFTLGDDYELEEIKNKIREIYDIDPSEIEDGKLSDIFARLHEVKYGKPN